MFLTSATVGQFGAHILDTLLVAQIGRAAGQLHALQFAAFGHIGGDDFIVVTAEERGESIARVCAERFRDVIGRAVGSDALAAGTFAGVDREGMPREFPLAKLTAVVLLVDPIRWQSPSRLGESAAEAKRRARGQGAGTIHVEPV